MIAFMIDNDNCWIEQQNRESLHGLSESVNVPTYEADELEAGPKVNVEEYLLAMDSIRNSQRSAPPDNDVASEVYK
jgi:hypothetical protein